MSQPQVIVGPGDVVATVPHLLGACPNHSIVVFPVSSDRSRPVARLDIPGITAEHTEVAQALAASYYPFAGGHVVLVAFTDQLERAASICEAVAHSLEPDSTVVCQVAAQGDTWVRLDANQSGTISQADRDRIAVDFVADGNRQPYDSVAQLRASFDARGEDLSVAVQAAAELTETTAVWAVSMAAEERWMSHAIEGFVATGRPLPTADAARLIGDAQTVPLRDHAAATMTRQEAGAHAALWKDLLTRCPEQARTPVATLAAFGSWLHGNGMQARLALERVTDPTDKMAHLVGTLVAVGANPRNWKPPQRPWSSVDERIGPSSRHDPRRDAPRGGRDGHGPRPGAMPRPRTPRVPPGQMMRGAAMSAEPERSPVEASLRATIDHQVTRLDHYTRGASIAPRDAIGCPDATGGQPVDLVFSVNKVSTI